MSDLNLRVSLTALDQATAPMRRAMAAAKGLAGGLSEAQKSLAALNRQQRDIAAYRQGIADTKRLRTEWQAARQRVGDLAAAQAKAGEVTKAHARQMTQAQAAADKLKAAYLKKGSAARDMGARLKQAGIETGNLAAHEQRIKASIDRTTAALERQNKARAQSVKMGKIAAGMAAGGAVATAVGTRITRTALAPVEQYRAHEDAMLGVARQVPGARDEMGRLTEVYRQAEREVRALSEAIPLTTVQIADMYTAAARMEVPTEHLADQVKLAAEMAIAFDAVPDEIAEAMGKVAKNYQMPVTQIRGLADAINYLDDNAISKGSDIIDFLNRTSGVVSTVAMTAQQAAALGSTLLTLGERGETASTATNAIVQKLAAASKGTKKMREALQEIGLAPEAVQKGMASDAIGTLNKVMDGIRALPKDQRIGVMVELIGLEHSDTLAKLVDKPDELKRQLDLAQGTQAAGSMAREAGARYDTLSARVQVFENRLFTLKAVAGETLLPVLTTLIEKTGPIVTQTMNWTRENAGLVKGLMMLAAGAGVLATVGGTTAMALATVLGPMALLVRMWPAISAGAAVGAKAFALIGRAALVFMASPIGIAFALITAAIALWVTRWDAIKGGAIALWTDIKSVFSAGIAWLASLPARMLQAGADIINGLMRGITSRLAALRDTITGVADSAANWFKGKLGIQSPSRVFMQLGGWVSEGAALGIAGKAPLVARAAAAMAALPGLAAAPALAATVAAVPTVGSAGPATAAPASYSITINAAPGQDPQAIARAVAAEIDRRERQRTARGYSRLTDR